MNETQTRQLLGDLAQLVPDGAAPVEAVLRGGRLARARRRRRQVSVAVAAVVLVAVAGFLVARPGDGSTRPGPVAAQDPQGAPSRSPSRQVGLGRVSVTVPESWTSDQPEGCLDVPQGGVVVSDLRVDCTTPDGAAPATVVIAPESALIGPREDLALLRAEHEGLELYVQPEITCERGAGVCSTLVMVPSEGLAVRVEVDAASREQIDGIVDSIAPLPGDRFAVPPDLVGARLEPALRSLRELGAAVSYGTTGGGPIVTRVHPDPGTVVAVGGDVDLDYGSVVAPPPDVDLGGTWTIMTTDAIPPDGVSAQIVFTDDTVRLGRCGPWEGDYVTSGDEIRFTDLAQDNSGRACRDSAEQVAGLLTEVEHVTRAGSRVYLHRASYEIVATLRR